MTVRPYTPYEQAIAHEIGRIKCERHLSWREYPAYQAAIEREAIARLYVNGVYSDAYHREQAWAKGGHG